MICSFLFFFWLLFVRLFDKFFAFRVLLFWLFFYLFLLFCLLSLFCCQCCFSITWNISKYTTLKSIYDGTFLFLQRSSIIDVWQGSKDVSVKTHEERTFETKIIHQVFMILFLKQPSIGVLTKSCSENMQQIFRTHFLKNTYG